MNHQQIDEILFRAATAHQSGQVQQAAALYRQVLATDAANPVANHNLGVLAMQTGQGLTVATPLFAAAWQADPSHLQHWLSYLRALVQSGDIERARNVHADGSRRGLRGPDVDTLRARMAPARPAAGSGAPAAPVDLRAEQAELDRLLGAGQAVAAERMARQLTTRHPQHPAGWRALGLSLLAQQREQEALLPLERATQVGAPDAVTLNALGAASLRLGLAAEAEAAYRKALALDPRQLPALIGLAGARNRAYRHAEAEATSLQALALDPASADACLALGEAQLGLRRLDEAQASFRRALQLRPGWADAYQKLGTLLHQQGDDTGMLEIARQMTLDAPGMAEAHADLGSILMRAGRLEEAVAAFRAALRLRPADLGTRNDLLFCLNYIGQLPPRALLDEALAYGQQASAQARPYRQWDVEANPERLRVGLVSGDLREHPVAFFLESVLAHADRQCIEWYVYSTHAAADATTARLRAHVDQWRILAGLSAEESARLIHADRVHLLVDLAGHSALNALATFAWRPAPVQVSWLGYFATTGLAEMDYLLADARSVPDADRGRYTETIWHLPETRLCFTPPDPAPPVAALPAIANGHVTFGSFQALRKLNDDVLATWAEVLRACPGARLRVQNAELSGAAARSSFGDRAQRAGIDTARLELCGAEPRMRYLAQHAEVDILLDSFPFPGGTTTCEALWMGVPTLTLEGSTLIGRQGACMMAAAGLPDWVAASREDYVALALQKAADLPALGALRDQLRQRLPSTPLFDAARFARALEQAFRQMWERRAASLPAR